MPRLARPEALVFDLDGTLVDSRRDIALASNHALQHLGMRPLPEDLIAGFVGDGARALLARLIDADQTSPRVDEALAVFHPYYAAHVAVHTTWMPGAREALVALSHLPLCLSTNKPRAATLALLDALGAATLFAGIAAGGDGPLKPDPRAIHAALVPSGVLAGSAWVVGDGVQDVEAGRAAGSATIAVRGGFASDERLREAQPDVLLDSLRDLVPLVRGAG